VKLWTQSLAGRIHQATAIINAQTPCLAEFLVTLVDAGWRPDTGVMTTAVFCVSDELYAELQAKRLNPPVAVAGEPIVISGGADGVVFSLEDGK